MKSFVEYDKDSNGNYLRLLSAVSKLSGLFSESSIPYINYRVAENIFCKSFNAENLSRSDAAFDANFNSIGIGLKTFTCPSDNSNEKVAEFNSLSKELAQFKGEELALKLAEFRNERIDVARRVYGVEKSLYHIVARKEKELILFETDYDNINLSGIHAVKTNKSSLQFEDGNNLYLYNYSKSTLFRKFIVPNNAFRHPIEIIDDPYSLLLEIFENNYLKPATDKLIKGVNFVVLPLYGIKNNEKHVFEKSGLNQWNAGGRKRNLGELYIPIPIEINKSFASFFPDRDIHFNLMIPTGEIFNAKVCQANSKALMTDPNKALSNWLLRDVLGLEEGKLATIEKLNELGVDSVIITKTDNKNYKIDIMKTDSYWTFINNLETT